MICLIEYKIYNEAISVNNININCEKRLPDKRQANYHYSPKVLLSELFHYANRLILNEVKGIECLLLAAKLLNQIQIKKS